MSLALYDRWVAEGLPQRLPEESLATCENCAMCASAQGPSQQITFRPDTKCCTFVPRLANFIVGGILCDSSPEAAEGQATIQQRLMSRGSVSPLGLMIDPIIRNLHELGVKEAFGRSEQLRCPHYSANGGGTCSIWRHRNAVCYTWFCKHERGQVGQQFWNGLRDLLSSIEESLSVWCALELGISDRAVVLAMMQRSELAQSQVGRALLANGVQEAAMWEGWQDTAEVYYETCSRLVEELGWGDVMKICGPSERALWGKAKNALDALVDPRPIRRPTLGICQISRESTSELRIGTYSPYNPLIVPNDLQYILNYFDGRPLQEILKHVLDEQELDLDLSLIQRLMDFGVLREQESSHSDARGAWSQATCGD